jgi:all-trans-retinol dehydrogenase (NAD+)
MLRCAALAATCTALHLAGPASSLVGLLKWGLALWTVVEFNSVLNRWAEDRWVWTADHGGWDWNKEIAVVTGGSNGIGACIVQKLVAHGIKVAILDVGPMADSFTDGVTQRHLRLPPKTNPIDR